jgi:hypothetical protein
MTEKKQLDKYDFKSNDEFYIIRENGIRMPPKQVVYLLTAYEYLLKKNGVIE